MFGENNNGQLGNGTTTNSSTSVAVSTGNGYDGTNATMVSCGYNFTAILLTTGKVVMFGYNNRGQLGKNNSYGMILLHIIKLPQLKLYHQTGITKLML